MGGKTSWPKQVTELEGLIKKSAKKYEGLPIALSGGVDSGLLAALIKPQFAIHIEIIDKKQNEVEKTTLIANHLKLRFHIVGLDMRRFEKVCKLAFKIIGEPIPHFNIFPLYEMYRTLHDVFRVDKLVLADGPDETMCGYTRHLIMNYLFGVYTFEGFQPYIPTIKKIFPFEAQRAYQKMVGGITLIPSPGMSLIQWMCKNDMLIKRKEMDKMSNRLAKHFGIKNVRPYQDNQEVDEYMYNLPPNLKVGRPDCGKYALRMIAEKYLPKEIAWNKVKVGGPLLSPNKIMGWEDDMGEYGKERWLLWQKEVLSAKD